MEQMKLPFSKFESVVRILSLLFPSIWMNDGDEVYRSGKIATNQTENDI